MGWLHLWFLFHIRGKSGPRQNFYLGSWLSWFLLNSWCRHKVNENMDLESQDPRFNANLGQILIWTKKDYHLLSHESTAWIFHLKFKFFSPKWLVYKKLQTQRRVSKPLITLYFLKCLLVGIDIIYSLKKFSTSKSEIASVVMNSHMTILGHRYPI